MGITKEQVDNWDAEVLFWKEKFLSEKSRSEGLEASLSGLVPGVFLPTVLAHPFPCENVGMFPIMDGPDMPWVILQAHAKRAFLNHSQSLDTLASRGGLSMKEAVWIVDELKVFTPVPDPKKRFEEIIREHTVKTASKEIFDLKIKTAVSEGRVVELEAELASLKKDVAKWKNRARDVAEKAEVLRRSLDVEEGQTDYHYKRAGKAEAKLGALIADSRPVAQYAILLMGSAVFGANNPLFPEDYAVPYLEAAKRILKATEDVEHTNEI